jgi:hypothetical protein
MNIDFNLERKDFIEYQLFTASKSETIINSWKKSRIRIPIVYLILGLFLFVFADKVFALIFFGIGAAWYFLYPSFMRKRYLKHFERYVDENLKNRFGKHVSLIFGEEYIDTIDYMGESKLKINEITEVNEIKSYIYLKFSSGESLIIPKIIINQKNEFNNWIKNLVQKLKIQHNLDLNWKWR